MASRLILHEELCKLLGSKSVYFQPPGSGMTYPCIKYSLSGIDQDFANNKSYKNVNRYMVTVIDEDPDSTIHKSILEHFEMCSFDRWYAADNLNHYVLTLYY